jgi:SAM-dependent methyltransferase
METVKKFYDDIAKYYHLIYSNWEESTQKQGERISKIIKENWGVLNKSILDCTCGIGTQALGLASLGFRVTGSDLSSNAIQRAKFEAKNRDLDIDFSVTDVRHLWKNFKNKFDIVISCDNSLPHLPNDNEFVKGLKEIFKCTKPTGGCIISVRDYEKDISSGTHLLPYGVREVKNDRYMVFQVRDFFNKDHYNVNLYFVKDSGSPQCKTAVFRSQYYAISINKIMKLMKNVGFVKIKRIDDGFFQPVIIGTRPKNK